MASLSSDLTEALNMFDNQQSTHVLILGLDKSGKTTMLHHLKLRERITTAQKIGFLMEEVAPIKNVTFTGLDVCRQENLRKLWRQYYKGTDGLVFVFDSTDMSRIQEARNEIVKTLKDQSMDPGVPFLVLANKQDLPNAAKAPEIAEAMNLEELSRGRPWYVHEMVATSGNGLCEGVSQLAEMVKEFQATKKVSKKDKR